MELTSCHDVGSRSLALAAWQHARTGPVLPQLPRTEFRRPCRPLLHLVHPERLAHRLDALLVRRPHAAADQAAIDHKIMAVDEARLVRRQEYRGMGNVGGDAGARNPL